MVLSLRQGSVDRDIAREIARSGANHGIGLIFGTYSVRHVLKSDEKFVDDVLKETPRPLVFLITSHPLENDVMDLFEQQLNAWNGAEPAKASILKFLHEVLSITGVEKVVAVVWDSMVPDYHLMPKYQVSPTQFVDSIKNFYRDQVGGPEGIFKIELGPNQ